MIALVQDELHAIAHGARRRWSPPPSLATTELVSEAYVRLFGHAPPRVHDRKHFFCLMAKTIRCVIIDRHRKRRLRRAAMDPGLLATADAHGADLVEIDDALERLAAFEPAMAHLVELRFFVGLSAEEAGQAMGISGSTQYRLWKQAKQWLWRALGGARRHDAGAGGA